MKYIRDTLEFHNDKPSVITMGKFDGLHRGHELLMEHLLETGNEQHLYKIVFTFDIPPKSRVFGEDSYVLTTNEEKRFVFERTGIDCLIECPFNERVMHMEPEEFIAWIVNSLHAKYFVCGRDFHFGHNRAGDYRVLQSFEEKYGYKTIVLDKVQEDERDISSTFVREQISLGNMEKANHLLGYSFFIRSRVVHGNQIGRKMGIPTINMILPPEKLLPPYGVYVTRVLIGENSYKGVSNVGCKPTIEGDNPVGVETFILDFCQDVYEEEIMVEFLHYVRPEKRFDSLEELKQQISSDIAFSERYYRNVTKMC